MTEKCKTLRDALLIGLGLDPEQRQPGETQDQPQATFHVADSGEISIWTTRVPPLRALLVLMTLRGDMDAWLISTQKTDSEGTV